MPTIRCFTCQTCCDLQEWFDHLVSKTHLRRSRKCIQKWTEGEKARSLILFSNFPLVNGKSTGAEEGGGGGGEEIVQDKSGVVALLQQCSEGGVILANFAAWEERPYTGVVLFQTTWMVKMLITRLRKNSNLERTGKIWLDEDHVATPRKVTDFGEKELLEFLPMQQDADPPENAAETEVQSSFGGSVGNLEANEVEPLVVDDDGKPVPVITIHDDGGVVAAGAFGFSVPRQPSLQHSIASQYRCIKDIVAVSDFDFQKVVQVVQSLKSVFIAAGAVEAALFKNFYLKLKNPLPNQDLLLIFLCTDQPHTNIFINGLFSLIPELPAQSQQQPGWKTQCNINGVQFRLITDPKYVEMVQMCRMVDYLLTFDPRCKPLMTLVYYWATLNAAHLEPSFLEPITLQWLVVFFLSFRRIVPSPREVQAIPHLVLYDTVTASDVGFYASPNYQAQWVTSKNPFGFALPPQSNDQLIASVLLLFQHFLEFYQETLLNSTWILNARDGELVDLATVMILQDTGTSRWLTKTTMEERAMLRSHPCIQAAVLNLGRCKLHVVHPFSFAAAICLPCQVEHLASLMKRSAQNIQHYMQALNNCGIDVATERFGGLTDLLKL